MWTSHMLHLTTLLLFALTPCSVGLQRFIVTFRHQAEPAPSSHKPLSSIVDNVCNLNSNTSCALTCLHTFHGGCAYGFAARFRNRSSLHAFVHQCIGFDMIKDIEADVPTESTANRNQLQVPCNATPSELGNETQWSLRRITDRLDDSKGSGVNIYVLDSGIRASHVEFTSKDGNSSRAILGYDAITKSNIAFSSDADGHGTHVASNAGGATAGLAKNASLIGVRVLNKRGRGRVGNALAGLDYIAMAQSQSNRPAVINMSLGVPRQLRSRTLSAAVTSISQNITVIVASGNVREVSSCSITPAFLDSVLTVSASNIENKPYNASSLGECVDLFGPGEKIRGACGGPFRCADPGDMRYTCLSGTSMAAAHASGAAALVLQKEPSLSSAKVKQRLLDNARSDVISLGQIRGASVPNKLLFVP